MTNRLTRIRAWDDAWNLTGPVHHLGSQHERTKHEKEVAEAMGELARMPLPIDAIYEIGRAVLAAWEAGRES